MSGQYQHGCCCEPAPVACCFPNGQCLNLSPDDCLRFGGIPDPQGRPCASVQCPQPPPCHHCSPYTPGSPVVSSIVAQVSYNKCPDYSCKEWGFFCQSPTTVTTVYHGFSVGTFVLPFAGTNQYGYCKYTRYLGRPPYCIAGPPCPPCVPGTFVSGASIHAEFVPPGNVLWVRVADESTRFVIACCGSPQVPVSTEKNFSWEMISAEIALTPQLFTQFCQGFDLSVSGQFPEPCRPVGQRCMGWSGVYASGPWSVILTRGP